MSDDARDEHGDKQRRDALEIAPDLLEGWRQLFVNRSQPYALQQEDGSYRWRYEPCTLEILAAHLSGKRTLALSSTDARGWCRWACLDVDISGALPQLLALRVALAARGLPGLVEASRRGGHLWIFCDESVPALAVRYAVQEALADVAAQGTKTPPCDFYPDTTAAGALGHAVRLPLGVHRLTGRRYPLFDGEGLPCVFSDTGKAAAFVLNAPRAPAHAVMARWRRFLDAGGAQPRRVLAGASSPLVSLGRPPGDVGLDLDTYPRADVADVVPADASSEPSMVAGTRSTVIRWVDANVSPLDIIDELTPRVLPERRGQGYAGWCPFHDDHAPDALGRPGSRSFYLVHNRRYGWSWRCLSTNCAHSFGPMRHSFRLFQELLALDAPAAIRAAATRWPASTGADGDAERDDER